MENRIRDLQARRLAKALSQEELAEQAGVSVKTVQRLEKGEPASPRSQRRIVNALGISLDEVEVSEPSLESAIKVVLAHQSPWVNRVIVGFLAYLLLSAGTAILAVRANPFEAAAAAAAEEAGVAREDVRFRKGSSTFLPLVVITRANVAISKNGVTQYGWVRIVHTPVLDRWALWEFSISRG